MFATIDSTTNKPLEINFDYQIVGRDFLYDQKRAILGDEMRLGKTVQAIAAMKKIVSERPEDAVSPFPMLIVCPKITMKNVWLKHLTQPKIQGTVNPAYWPEVSVTVLDGTAEERITNLICGTSDIYIINYEGMRVLQEMGLLSKKKFVCVVFDEAHKMKNREAKVQKAGHDLAKEPEFIFMLTGTPILNREEELWSLLNILYSKKFTSFWSWANYHMYMKRVWVSEGIFREEIDGPKDPWRFQENMKKYLLRRERSDVLKDMPPKIYEDIEVELEGKQLEAYIKMRDFFYTELASGKEMTAMYILAQLTRLRQIAVSADLLEPEIRTLEGAKPEMLQELCDDLDGPIVILSKFSRAITRLGPILGKEYKCITGKTPNADRVDLVEKFQEGKIKFLGLNMDCAIGLDLSRATKAIQLDEDYTPANNDQATDRLVGIRQKDPVTIFRLSAKDSVDQWIRELNLKKRALFGQMIPITHLDVIRAVQDGSFR